MKEIFKASRNWGEEYLVLFAPKYYTLKILKINSGHKGGLQSHHLKFETGIVLSGKLKIKKGKSPENLKETILNKGELFTFEPGIVHQEEAITEAFILEISSPHFNDRVRYDHLQNDDNFLPSTNKHEVLELENYNDLERIKEYGFIKVGINEKNFIENILKNSFL